MSQQFNLAVSRRSGYTFLLQERPARNVDPPDRFDGQAAEPSREGWLQLFLFAMKTNVYVDGFNLYYGAVKGTPYRWLDLGKLWQMTLPKNQINRIRYFTARVASRPADPLQPRRQQVYLRALLTIPNLTIHYGHFLRNIIRMPLVRPPAGGPDTVEVWKTEEKGSDVNLASYLLLDCFDKDCEAAAIVSNDSDLAEPIRLARKRFGIKVVVLHPVHAPYSAGKRPRVSLELKRRRRNPSCSPRTC